VGGPVAEPADVPSAVVGRLRPLCLGLPETYEQAAWVGVRWRVRRHTFAHVLTIEAGWPPAYARAAGSDGPATVVTFRCPGSERDELRSRGEPFFVPEWWPDAAGMRLDGDVDWAEVAELLTESYCALAPKKLVRLIR
jgi:hypothetical protein